MVLQQTARRTRHRFTVEDYEAMVEAGILTPDDRVELIDGQVLEMSPIGHRHAALVDRVAEQLFGAHAHGQRIVRVQSPIRLGRFSEPQPDITLLRRRDDFYADRHPGPDDVLLVVEVALSSETYDREVKLPLYARHGIQEAWLQCGDARLEVHRTPTPDGYAEVRVLTPGDIITPAALPELELNVAALLGEA